MGTAKLMTRARAAAKNTFTEPHTPLMNSKKKKTRNKGGFTKKGGENKSTHR